MADYYKEAENLKKRLRAVGKKETGLKFAVSAFRWLTLSILVVLAVSLIESFANGDSTFRGVLFYLALTAILGFGIYFFYPSFAFLTKAKNPRRLSDLALRAGSNYQEIKDKLCNALQIADEFKTARKRVPNVSEEFAEAAVLEAAELSRGKDFEVILNKKESSKSALYFLLALAVFIFAFSLSDGLREGFVRTVRYSKSYLPPAPFTLKVEPLRAKILRNSKATVKVVAIGRAPERVSINLREKGQKKFEPFKVKLKPDGSYSFEMAALRNDVEFYASAEWLTSELFSDTGRIEVYDKPFVKRLFGYLKYPAYARVKPRKFTEKNADIIALRGSKIYLKIEANKKLKSASLVLELKKNLSDGRSSDLSQKADSSASAASAIAEIDTVAKPMKIKGTRAEIAFTARESGEYKIKLEDFDGERNDNPTEYSITVLSDDFPTIVLIEPIGDAELTDRPLLPIRAAIADDYGFTKAELRYRLAKSKYSAPDEKFKTVNLLLDKSKTAQELIYVWDLNEIGASPEDIYEFYLAVYDNDAINGPKKAKTRSILVKLPSLEQIVEESEKTQELAEKQIQDALKETQKLRRDIDQANKAILKARNPKKLDWRTKKKIEELKKRSESLSKRLRKIASDIEKSARSLERKNAISSETMQKYMELQK